MFWGHVVRFAPNMSETAAKINDVGELLISRFRYIGNASSLQPLTSSAEIQEESI